MVDPSPHVPPGSPPLGYKRGKEGLILDRSKVPIVRAFFEHFLLYGSLRAAVRQLNQRFGKSIAVTTGRNWLVNPLYRGDLPCGGDPPQVLRDTHPAILSREEAAQIDRVLSRNRGLAPRSASAKRSLAGLVRCQQCDHAMTIVSAKKRQLPASYLYLRASACPLTPRCKGLPYDTVLHRVIERVCQTLPQALSPQGGSRLTALKQAMEQEIERKQSLLQQIPHLLSQDIFDRETADLRTFHLKTEIAQLHQNLSQLPPLNLSSIVQTICIPAFWHDLSETERRKYFREFIRSITVDAAAEVTIQFLF